MPLAIDINEAGRFLRALDPEASRFTFQIFDDDKERKNPALAKVFHNTLDNVARALTSYNEQGAGVFVTVNRTDLEGRRAENVTDVRACFVDLDGAPLDKVLADETVPRPHIVVETSPGRWHCYWLVVGMALSDFEHAQKALIARYSSDKSIHDLPRVMRLPGFWHVKSEPSLVKIQSIEPLPPYQADEWLAVVARIAPPPAKKREKARARDHDSSGRLNELAMKRLDAWVPVLFPEAREYQGGYRITSKALGRDLEEDLSIVPEGIKDFGVHDTGDEREGKRTPLDVVMEYKKCDVYEATTWLRSQLGLEQIIIMRPGALVDIIDKAQAALIKQEVQIYERGGDLVMPVKFSAGAEVSGEVKHQPGATVLIPVRSHCLVEKMAGSARWARLSKGRVVNADPDVRYAVTIMESKDMWKFPHLRGIVLTPTLTRDGGILEIPGYDPRTGLLLDFAHGAFPPIPQNPTREEAAAALERLEHPLRGFPFVGESETTRRSPSRSVALSALLTVLVRASLRTAPLHAYDAPMAGTGKSICAETPGLLANGVKPPAMAQGKTDEEDEKRLATILFSGDNVLLIDNCERPIRGDLLCQMLTQERVQARILGQSERRIIPCTTLVTVTGNNLIVVGDATRRTFRCRMDAKTERPDLRVFDFNVGDEILANRPELVVCALTALRAYHVAGRPAQITPMGSFDDHAWIRGTLVWLGHPDPIETREEILKADPRKRELAEVLEAWIAAFGDQEVRVAEIGQVNGEAGARTTLRELLFNASGCRGVWNAHKVGWWLRRHMAQVTDGKYLVQREEHGTLWRVVAAGSGVVVGAREAEERLEDEIPF